MATHRRDRFRSHVLRASSAIAIISAAFGSQASLAQVASSAAPSPNIGSEIIVTGSRVTRNGYQAPTPVTVLSGQSIAQIAPINVADAVNRLPQLTASVTPLSQPAGVSGGSLGVNQLNLRGLGPTRTLVLLDGKRIINSSINSQFAAPDVNSIPNGLVSRVDVVTGGASAAYGSDALAGVVNFVLDHNFTGLKGEVLGGETTYGDNKAYVASLTGGLRFGPDNRGHLLVSGEVAHNDGIKGNNRTWDADPTAIMVNPRWSATNGQPYYLVADQIGVSNGTPGGLITRGPLRGVMFGPGGTTSTFNFGLVSTNNLMSGGDWKISRIDNGLDLEPHNLRETLFGRLSYDVSEDVQLYGELQWSFDHAVQTATPNRRLDNVTIHADNPFIPPSVAAALAASGQSSFVLGTTNGDIGRVVVDNRRTLKRGDVGGTGKFDLLGHWTWDAYAQESVTIVDSRAKNVAITSNYLLAADAVRNQATGAIVCRSTLTNPSNGCVPYDTMGLGVNTPAAIAYVTGTGYRRDDLTQDIVSANLHGEPLSTWAGPVSVALGVEHRRESVTGQATALDEANAFFTGNFHASTGAYNVNEAYLETVIPLAKDYSWAKTLELNAAARLTDYSTSGKVTTWKIGLNYAPIDDIRFRATRSRDIRAPNLGELYSKGQTSSGAALADPFTGTTVTNSFALSTGNPNLKPEIGKTTAFGVVVSPRFIPRFQASVDYYAIKISGAIQVPAPQSIINGCFAGNTILCSLIQRTNGVITLVVTSPQNVQSLTTHGFDFDASYDLPLSALSENLPGTLNLRGYATYVPKLTTKNLDGSTIEGAGVLSKYFGDTSVTGPFAPKFRALVSATYQTRPITATLTMRYVGPGVYNNLWVSCTSNCPVGSKLTVTDNHIPSNTVFDAALSYRPWAAHKETEFFVTVDNIFNTYPPLIAADTGNGYYQGEVNFDYDRIGRTIRAGFRFRI